MEAIHDLSDNEGYKILQLHKALEIGENSGMVADFDREKHLQQLHAKYLKKIKQACKPDSVSANGATLIIYLDAALLQALNLPTPRHRTGRPTYSRYTWHFTA